MKSGFLIYGCNGYTGKLIAEHAVKSGLSPILAGRDAEKVKALAAELNLPYRVFDLNNIDEVVKQISDVKIVLHCAGPFKYTALPMAKACLKAQTHYLDITGEYQVFEQMFKLNDQAKKAGIVIMPGVGFDVVPTDCLSLYLKEQLPNADTLELALYQRGGRISHGTAITVAENLGESCVVRRKGSLVNVPNGRLTRSISLLGKNRNVVAIPWGDVSTAYRTTGIPNITVYNLLPQKVVDSMKMSNYLSFILKRSFVKSYLAKRIKKRPAGPSEEERTNARTLVWGEVRNPLGVAKRAVLDLPEGYTLTALTAIKIVQQFLATQPPAGTRTPAQVLGKDFILQFEGVERTEA